MQVRTYYLVKQFSTARRAPIGKPIGAFGLKSNAEAKAKQEANAKGVSMVVLYMGDSNCGVYHPSGRIVPCH